MSSRGAPLSGGSGAIAPVAPPLIRPCSQELQYNVCKPVVSRIRSL